MANTKSSKKDLRRSVKRTLRNRETKSALKTYIKKSRLATVAGEAGAIKTTLETALSQLDKASQRGVIHKNQAARRKSRIAKAAAAALKNGGPVVSAPVAEKPKAVAVKKAAPAAKAPAAKKPAAPKKAKAD